MKEKETALRPTLRAAYSYMKESDRELADIAKSLLDKYYVRGRHEVAASMRLENGLIVTGVHMEASQGRASICAEGVAIGKSLEEESAVVSIVSVLHRPDDELYLIEPCGVCAELLFEYCPDATIWVGDKNGNPQQAMIRDLLPFHKARVGR